MEIHYRLQGACRECGHFLPAFEIEGLRGVVCPRCGGDLEVFRAEELLLA